MYFFATSCSDDDSVELEDVTTLNMLNEDNGKTYLGNSDIYITDENNFSGSSCLLVELGGANGIERLFLPGSETDSCGRRPCYRDAFIRPSIAIRYSNFLPENLRLLSKPLITSFMLNLKS